MVRHRSEQCRDLAGRQEKIQIMAGKNTKKKTRKNSNYKTVVKYVNVDQLFRKALCDYRNMPEVDPSHGRSPEVDQNKYEKAVHFCTVAQIITPEEKEAWFDGKNHVPVTAEEAAEFTGIPVYQVEKNEFAFKARQPEDYVRVSLVRLALCDLVNDIISNLDPESELDASSPEAEDAACYINFCLENGIITQEQGLSIYVQLKQKIQLDLPFIAGITGLDVEVLQKMAEA